MKVERSICIAIDYYILKTTTPIFVGGKTVPAGTLIEVSHDEMQNIKARNRAVDATESEIAAAENIIVSSTVDHVDNLANRMRDARRQA